MVGPKFKATPVVIFASETVTKKIFPLIKNKKFIYGSLTVLAMTTVFTVSNVASGQEAIPTALPTSTPTPSPTPTTTEGQVTDTEADFKTLKEVAEKKMAEYPELIREGYKPFEIGNWKIENGWAKLNLVSFEINPPKDTHLNLPAVFLAVANKNSDNNWQVTIENEQDYKNQLLLAPDTLISERVKKGFKSYYEDSIENSGGTMEFSGTLEDRHAPGLPFLAGEEWRYSQGPSSEHGSFVSETAFDFLTPSGNSEDVRAAEDGTVTYVNETCLKVDRYHSGVEFVYQHIDSNDIDDWEVYDPIDLGDQIGNTTENSGCGGNSEAHHVHFEFHSGDDIDGASLNGWVVDGVNLVKEGSTKVPSTSSPPDVLHGDWIIALGSSVTVDFVGQAQLPQDLIIKNSSGMQLGNDSEDDSLINIDFINYNLFVESGSGLLVKDGAKLD